MNRREMVARVLALLQAFKIAKRKSIAFFYLLLFDIELSFTLFFLIDLSYTPSLT